MFFEQYSSYCQGKAIISCKNLDEFLSTMPSTLVEDTYDTFDDVKYGYIDRKSFLIKCKQLISHLDEDVGTICFDSLDDLAVGKVRLFLF